MKKYIFFTRTVFGIGGGQLYISNKSDYLRKLGYKVYSVSCSIFSRNGKIFYKELNQVENYVLTELDDYPELYSPSKREKIINTVIERISPEEDDDIVFESNRLSCAVWAELIAARVKCKHIIFSVSEHNPVNDHLCGFLEFKFKRGEFATIGAKTFDKLFSRSELITEQNIPVLRAYLGDYICDEVDERLLKVEKSDYNICIIGRGEKDYIEYSCFELAEFCNKHPSVSFSVGLVSKIGDKQKEQRIIEKFEKTKNLKVYYLGYFSPIPRALFEMFDLYIGGAGCAALAYRQNVLTLAMDLHNDRPLGFMGYDVCATSIVSEEDANMAEFLDDAFFKKEYLKKEYKPALLTTAAEAFAHHDRFLENSSKEAEYYTKINPHVSLKEKIRVKFPFIIKLYRTIKR